MTGYFDVIQKMERLIAEKESENASIKEQLSAERAARERAEADCAEMREMYCEEVAKFSQYISCRCDGAQYWIELSKEEKDDKINYQRRCLAHDHPNPGQPLLDRLKALEADLAAEGRIKALEVDLDLERSVSKKLFDVFYPNAPESMVQADLVETAKRLKDRIEGLEESLRVTVKVSQEREHALELMDKLVRGEDAEWYSWQRVYQTMEEIIKERDAALSSLAKEKEYSAWLREEYRKNEAMCHCGEPVSRHYNGIQEHGAVAMEEQCPYHADLQNALASLHATALEHTDMAEALRDIAEGNVGFEFSNQFDVPRLFVKALQEIARKALEALKSANRDKQ